jgi:succinoglycan biosynthesis transport protein ExoP
MNRSILQGLATEEPEIDLRAIASVLRRQWRIIAASAVMALALAGIALFALTPIYSSTALILVDPSKKNLLEPDTQVASAAADSARIDSEVELVRSDATLIKVIRQMNLIETKEFGPALGIVSVLRLGDMPVPTEEEAIGQTLGRLKQAVAVQRRGLTYLITVEARSQDSRLAADLANALAQAYIADQVQAKIDSILSSRAVLTTLIEEARTAMASSETTFDAFISDNLDRIATGSSRSDGRQLQDQLGRISASREALASTSDLVRKGLLANDWQDIVRQLQDDALGALESQRSQVASAISVSERGSPVLADLRQRLADIELQMRSAAENRLVSLAHSIAESQQQEGTLRQQLRQVVLQGDVPTEIITRMYEAQQTAQLARDQYQDLLARSQELDAQANLQIADSRVVSPALPSALPAFPNNALILTLSVLAGLAIGIAMAFVYEHFAGNFISEEQLESLLRVKVAGTIPFAKPVSEHDSLADLLLTVPLSAFSESIRRIRASIDHSLPKSTRAEPVAPVIMVSSTAPHEGKSTLSLALGRSYALAGTRVLLIDADLRQPSIHRHVGITPVTGLLDFLRKPMTDYAQINEIIVDDSAGLSMILGAQRSDVPTDQLLTRDAFRHLVTAARHAFDVIIIDTPPVGPVVDAIYIGRYASLVLFVCKWASSSQAHARKALASLRSASGDAVPQLAVLNGAPLSKSGHQRSYSTYYSEG